MDSRRLELILSALSDREENCFALIGRVDLQNLEESFERIEIALDGFTTLKLT